MARMVHKATDGLSAEGLRVMIGGFRARKTYTAITRDPAEIGEDVPERTIARRAAEWRQSQERRENARLYVHDLVAAMKAQDVTAAEMVQALATDALLADPEAFTSGNPALVQRQNLKAEELRIKRAEMETRRRALDLDERKFALMQSREQRAVAALEEKGETMTAGERLQRVKEIYGLN